MSLADILGGTQISDWLSGNKNNPLYQQSQIQMGNQQFLNDQARNAYNSQLGGVPQQGTAGFDPTRMAGIQNQIGAAQGTGAQLANQGAGTLGTIQGGAQAGQSALQGIAAGGMPQFGGGMAQSYQNFMNPSLLGAQQALNNQANMAWNKGAANVGGAGGGFMNSGRNAAMGQAQENAATNLGMNQQQLAFNAATAAANAGQQAGNTGFQGQLSAGQALGNQALTGAQLTNDIQRAQLMPGATQEAAGTAFQNQAQNEMNTGYNNQLNQFQNPFKALQNYQSGLGVLGSNNYAPNLPSQTNIAAILSGLGISNPIGSLYNNAGGIADWLGEAGSGIGDFMNNQINPKAVSSTNGGSTGNDIDYGTYF